MENLLKADWIQVTNRLKAGLLLIAVGFQPTASQVITVLNKSIQQPAAGKLSSI